MMFKPVYSGNHFPQKAKIEGLALTALNYLQKSIFGEKYGLSLRKTKEQHSIFKSLVEVYQKTEYFRS